MIIYSQKESHITPISVNLKPKTAETAFKHTSSWLTIRKRRQKETKKEMGTKTSQSKFPFSLGEIKLDPMTLQVEMERENCINYNFFYSLSAFPSVDSIYIIIHTSHTSKG